MPRLDALSRTPTNVGSRAEIGGLMSEAQVSHRRALTQVLECSGGCAVASDPGTEFSPRPVQESAITWVRYAFKKITDLK